MGHPGVRGTGLHNWRIGHHENLIMSCDICCVVLMCVTSLQEQLMATPTSCCVQYYEMIGGLTSKPFGIFTLLICIFAALGSCLPQIVASSSSIYRNNQSLNKRGRSPPAGACLHVAGCPAHSKPTTPEFLRHSDTVPWRPASMHHHPCRMPLHACCARLQIGLSSLAAS